MGIGRENLPPSPGPRGDPALLTGGNLPTEIRMGISPDVMFAVGVTMAIALSGAVWRLGSIVSRIQGQIDLLRAERTEVVRTIVREEIQALNLVPGPRTSKR